MTDKLALAVNAATDQWKHARARMQAAGMGGGIDNKRQNAWAEYGYKDDLCFHDFYKLYSREGVAHGAVNIIAGKCWETHPEIIEGAEQDKTRPKTTWERSFDKLAKRIKLWDKTRAADVRHMVGRYSALIVQVADSNPWSQPLGRINEKQIIRLIPAWEGQLFVSDWEDDMTSDGYGYPTMYEYQEGNVGDAVRPRITEIHPDRIIIIGDIHDGVSRLQAGFNAAVNLEKVVGGSGESFLKNSARQLAVEYNDGVDLGKIAQDYGVSVMDLQEAFEAHAKAINRGNDALMVVQGGKVSPLVANVPDPESHFNVALQSFCASFYGLPSKAVVGNQTGERASTEDNKTLAAICMSRRQAELSSVCEHIVEWFIRHGALKPVEFSVIWSDLAEPTLGEKLDSVTKMVDANQKMLGAGVTVFTEEEIRQVAGYDAKEPEEPLGEVVEQEEESPE